MKISQKKVDARIQRLYTASCSGVQVPIMSIGQIFTVARAAVATGADDAAVTKAIVDFVATIRCN